VKVTQTEEFMDFGFYSFNEFCSIKYFNVMPF
jgi:hypothetical protein